MMEDMSGKDDHDALIDDLEIGLNNKKLNPKTIQSINTRKINNMENCVNSLPVMHDTKTALKNFYNKLF